MKKVAELILELRRSVGRTKIGRCGNVERVVFLAGVFLFLFSLYLFYFFASAVSQVVLTRY